MNSASRTADRPAVTGAGRRMSATSRRVGYVVAIVVNAVLLHLVNRSPGWEAVPFLTDDTARVLGLVNASLVAGIVANCVYAVRDPQWVRALGDLVTTAIGLAALLRLWTVFPLDLASAPVDWVLVARWVLGVSIAGSLIGLLVALTRLVRAALPRRDEHRP